MTAVERGDKCFVLKLWSAPSVDESRTLGQFREQIGVEEATRLLSQRQQADQYVTDCQHPLQPDLAMVAGHALDLARRAAPAGEREAEWLQSAEHGLAELSETEHADPARPGLGLWDIAPFAGPLLRQIGGQVAMQRKHGQRDIFLHHAHDAFL